VVGEFEVIGTRLNGQSVAFDNLSHGVIRISTTALSVATRKELVVDLRPVAARPPSGLLVCNNGDTTPGVSVYAVGSVAALGDWDVTRGVRLAPGPYPTWTAQVSDLPVNASIEWKCVKRREADGSVVMWQSGSNNLVRTSLSGYVGQSIGAF